MATPLVPVLDGLCFAEGPRWHEGRLWFSDMHAHEVLALDPDSGDVETIVAVPGRPSGLGWRPDGTMLVVSMTDQRLLALVDGTLDVVADLSGMAHSFCNDMVVDAAGNAYVGNFGFDLHDPEADQRTTNMILVTAAGDARVVADDLFFPNGTVITPDGSTLVVGESFGGALTAFDIDPDGGLSNRREWARVLGSVPDGICLDAEGAIWMTSPVSNRVVRVAEGGEILDEVRTSDERQPFACMLGGPERTTLFVCTAIDSDPEVSQRVRSGRIESSEVDVPGDGRP